MTGFSDAKYRALDRSPIGVYNPFLQGLCCTEQSIPSCVRKAEVACRGGSRLGVVVRHSLGICATTCLRHHHRAAGDRRHGDGGCGEAYSTV